jgi:hypothetical protein
LKGSIDLFGSLEANEFNIRDIHPMNIFIPLLEVEEGMV